MNAKKQIVALGGGGFSNDPQNLILDKYILSLALNERPAVCFIATASGDAESYRYKFYEAFSKVDCRQSHLSLFQPHTSYLQDFIFSQDVIYVGGGNTKSLLALWRDWGLDTILRAAYERGVVLAGVSAGTICWFERGVTDSIPGDLSLLACLGLLPGSCCPHNDSDEARRPAYHELLKSNKVLPGYGIDDWAGLHFVDGQLDQVISAKPDSTAYKVNIDLGKVQEIRLKSEPFPTIDN